MSKNQQPSVVSPNDKIRRFIAKLKVVYVTTFHHVINGSLISGMFLKLRPEKWAAPRANCTIDSIELCLEPIYTKYKAEVTSCFAGRARQMQDVFTELV